MSSEDATTHAAPAGTIGDDATALRKERDELYDRLLRTSAEFDNYRKRTDRERREWSDAAALDVVRDLLPVVDDLERALAARPEGGAPGADAAGAYWRGLELIHRRAIELLRKRGVEAFETVGQAFDPAWHEAVASEPAAGRRDGEITGELSRGYRSGAKLVRAAQVRVARA